MTKRERIQAAVKGTKPDKLPYSLWTHLPGIDLASMHREVPAAVRAHYRQLSANAADCTECRGCESRCPFHVPVVERMKLADNLL